MKRFAILIAVAASAGCGGGAGRKGTDEVTITTSDRARDILGLDVLLFEMKDRRENTGLKAWSFRLRNNEDEQIELKVVPLFVDPDGKELGGRAQTQEPLLGPGEEREFYFKGPTAAAARLIVTFELK